jgi:FdhD protein
MIDPCQSIQYLHYNGTTKESIQGCVIVESSVSLTVNGKVWISFMCTPVNLEALAVGFLFNERVINSMDEVADVHICDHNDNVDVWLTISPAEPKSWRRTSGCAGGVTAVESIKRPDFVSDSNEMAIPASHIPRLIDQLQQAQTLYRKSGGVHTTILGDGNQIIFSAEDIGRHNTLDKIAGLCLLQNTWPSQRILVTTGRISSEMLQKAARIGAKILISRTSPSSISIELAQAWGITLIGYARSKNFNLYTCPERIENIAELPRDKSCY